MAIHQTGGFFSDIAKGAANLVTAGNAYPKSGPLGDDGLDYNPWGLAPKTQVTECLLDEFGNRVTDCPAEMKVAPDCCKVMGFTTVGFSSDPQEQSFTVPGYGGTPGGTKKAQEALVKAKQKEIEKLEGEAHQPTIISMPFLGVGMGLDLTPGPGVVPVVEAPPLEVLPSAVPKIPTAILVGGGALLAILLVRGLMK
jgi:hypothetical protein